ncbi:ADP-ribosylation factor-like protein 6-interacting protein 4 [Pelodytes ibericus]
MDSSQAKRPRSRSISENKSVKKKKKSRSQCRQGSPSPVRKPTSIAKYNTRSPECHKKERKKKKMGKRKACTSSFSSSGSSSSSSSSTSNSSSDDSSDSDSKSKQNSHHKKKSKEKKRKKKVKKKSKKVKKKCKPKLKILEAKAKPQELLSGPSLDLCQKESLADCGPVLTDEQKSRIQAMKPMTKEEWDARQSVIRKVIDPETGRMRLIKGDGEVLEEIVSKDRHKEINKQATQTDGLTFQMRSGMF